MTPKVLWGSTIGYLSDSLVSCYVYWRRRALHAIYRTQQAIALSECRQTSLHTFQWLLEYETGDFWKKHRNCVAHFRYRGCIEYRDTWDGIVIVAPISGIAQHYTKHVRLPATQCPSERTARGTRLSYCVTTLQTSLLLICGHLTHRTWTRLTIRYDTIEEIIVDSKAEYTA